MGDEGLSPEAVVSFATLPTTVVLGPALGQNTCFASQPHRVMTRLTPWATESQGGTPCDLERIADLESGSPPSQENGPTAMPHTITRSSRAEKPVAG